MDLNLILRQIGMIIPPRRGTPAPICSGVFRCEDYIIRFAIKTSELSRLAKLVKLEEDRIKYLETFGNNWYSCAGDITKYRGSIYEWLSPDYIKKWESIPDFGTGMILGPVMKRLGIIVTPDIAKWPFAMKIEDMHKLAATVGYDVLPVGKLAIYLPTMRQVKIENMNMKLNDLCAGFQHQALGEMLLSDLCGTIWLAPC